MSLRELLAASGIRDALIVDDVFDAVPTAGDIGRAQEVWANFGDDLSPAQKDLIAAEYPPARNESFANLIADDSYVAAVWKLRDELGTLATPVFEDYLDDQASDRRYVRLAEEKLTAQGVTCKTAGRRFAEQALEADLILIDLYFGNAQDDAALVASMRELKAALKPRANNPPLVILMSRSSRLDSKRDEFRDMVGLVESAFRIIYKPDLVETERLEIQLERLAESAADSKNLARFFHAIEVGIAQAAERTLKLMRKLKLSDIGQIQQLLLSAEGESAGSYLVDVFDRVLQHEIERDNGIIEAARELNSISTKSYPPPYVAGSAELQQLVQRILTQNENRLQLQTSPEAVVTFGDVLRTSPNADVERLKQTLLVEITAADVLLVLTPVCDLQRNEVPRVLLLIGRLEPIEVASWTYKNDARTPAIEMDGTLQWVRWNLKHIDTVSLVGLRDALAAKQVRVAARLRDSHALELQQRVLSGLGRVGLVALLPATFLVNIEAYYANAEDRLVALPVPALADGAVCFVGRDADGNQVVRLVFTEGTYDGVERALNALDEANVSQHARKAFGHLKATQDLRKLMASGHNLKGVGDKKLSLIPAEPGAAGGLTHMGLIGWNYQVPDRQHTKNALTSAGIVFVIRDIAAPDAPKLSDVRQAGLLNPAAATADEEDEN